MQLNDHDGLPDDEDYVDEEIFGMPTMIWT